MASIKTFAPGRSCLGNKSKRTTGHGNCLITCVLKVDLSSRFCFSIPVSLFPPMIITASVGLIFEAMDCNVLFY